MEPVDISKHKYMGKCQHCLEKEKSCLARVLELSKELNKHMENDEYMHPFTLISPNHIYLSDSSTKALKEYM